MLNSKSGLFGAEKPASPKSDDGIDDCVISVELRRGEWRENGGSGGSGARVQAE